MHSNYLLSINKIKLSVLSWHYTSSYDMNLKEQPLNIAWTSLGPFQRHVCDQKSGKFHFWMASAPGANMLSTNFWLIIVLSVRVKTYRSLKIKFFVKVKNKVHVTIGHVCDFARNYGSAPNDFKVKILWCVMEFCIEQYTDDEQHIFKQFHILRMKFYRQDFCWCKFCLVTFVTFWCNVWVTFVTFLI